MRSFPGDFPILCPRTLDEALRAFAADADAPGSVTALAGATDLFVLWNAGQLAPTTFVSLHAVPELAAPLRWQGNTLVLSALTTYTDVRHDARATRELPLLGLAAREIGALQIQNRGTWAGNVANASPAADGVPALLAYDAAVTLTSVRGARTVALADYFTGYKQSLRAGDELITALHVPVPASGARGYWRKVGTRKLQAISKVVAAGLLVPGADGRIARARLALGSVAPIPLRARRVEAVVEGQALGPATTAAAVAALAHDIAPIDDIRSTRDYRMQVAGNLVREWLRPAARDATRA